MIDIGASTEPLKPSRGSKVAVIAFEPVVYKAAASKWLHHHAYSDCGGLHLVQAAVAADDGLSRMHATTRSVVVLGLGSIIDLIPKTMELWLLKIDAQGHDADTLQGAYWSLRRASYLIAEASLYSMPSYDGATNDFCDDHWILLQHDFELIALKGQFGQRPVLHHVLPTAIGSWKAGMDGVRAACDPDSSTGYLHAWRGIPHARNKSGGWFIHPSKMDAVRIGYNNEGDGYWRRTNIRDDLLSRGGISGRPPVQWPCERHLAMS